jgi:hypothetical protein
MTVGGGGFLPAPTGDVTVAVADPMSATTALRTPYRFLVQRGTREK